MKRVSFKIAKAIKNVGYPQDIQEVYKEDGEYFVSYIKYSNTFAAPTYLDVWLWLWREKYTKISCQPWYDGLDKWGCTIENSFFYDEMYEYNDPEEAIIAAIDYLVDNDLIK